MRRGVVALKDMASEYRAEIGLELDYDPALLADCAIRDASILGRMLGGDTHPWGEGARSDVRAKRRLSFNVVEGPRQFPCYVCKGKCGWNEGEWDCSWFEKCGYCNGEGHFWTGSDQHLRVMIDGAVNWFTELICRKWDDYYADDENLEAYNAAMSKVVEGVEAGFALYVKRYGAAPTNAQEEPPHE